MQFGIFDHMEARGGSLAELYRERLDYVAYADRAGFWCYHKAEHHMIPLDMAPSGNVFLAAAARATERIRLGSLVYLLPFHHPLRLAEEICMVDHLSEGRLEVGVGRGISPPEHALWGFDPDAARERSEETLDILIASLRAGRSGSLLDHEGTHYQFKEVPVLMQSLQDPYPDFWYPGNVDFALRHGVNTVIGGPLGKVREDLARFHNADSPEIGINPGGARRIGVSRHVFVAETDDAAIDRGRRAWTRYTDNLMALFRKMGVRPEIDPTVGGDFDRAREFGVVVAGSPDTVARDVAAVQEAEGDYYVGAFSWGDLDHAETMHSLRLFSDEVKARF